MTHTQLITPTRRLGGVGLRVHALPLTLLGHFIVFGLVLGVQGVAWDQIVAHLGFSKGLFGTVMLITPLAGFTVLLGGRALSRTSDKWRSLAALLAIAAALLMLAGAGTLWIFIASRLLAGLGYGLLEGAATGAALGWERATGRHLVGRFYAGLSVAMVLGALGGGALLGAGWGYPALLSLLAIITMLLATVTAWVAYPAATARADAGRPARAPGLRDRGLRLLTWLCVLGSAAEALAATWAVIHLVALGASAFVAGAGFALFNLAIVVGRLGSGALRARLGPRAAFSCAGLGAAVAAFALAQGTIAGVMVGLGALGLAIAGVVPLALSITGERSQGGKTGEHNTLLATTFLGFIVVPPLSGWMAGQLALQHVLVLVLLALAGGILWLTRRASWQVLE